MICRVFSTAVALCALAAILAAAPQDAAPTKPESSGRADVQKMLADAKQHEVRVARMERLREVFAQRGETDRVQKLDALLKTEAERHQKAMRAHRDRLGPDVYGRVERALSDRRAKRGTDRAGADRRGANQRRGKAGADRAGTDKAGSDKAGSDKAGADRAGADRQRPHAGTTDQRPKDQRPSDQRPSDPPKGDQRGSDRRGRDQAKAPRGGDRSSAMPGARDRTAADRGRARPRPLGPRPGAGRADGGRAHGASPRTSGNGRRPAARRRDR